MSLLSWLVGSRDKTVSAYPFPVSKVRYVGVCFFQSFSNVMVASMGLRKCGYQRDKKTINM